MSRKSLVEDALAGIKRIIFDRGLSPGQKIPTETALTQLLGISRGPIREAVKILSAIGILEIKRGDGTYIRDISVSSHFIMPMIFRLHLGRHNPVDLIELRTMFEQGILNLAVRKRLQRDIDRLRESLNRLEQLVNSENSDFKQIVHEDLSFHMLLFVATQNSLLVELGKSIMEFFIPALERVTKEHRGVHSIQHHRMLLKAVEERNYNLAEEAISLSIEDWKNYLY